MKLIESEILLKSELKVIKEAKRRKKSFSPGTIYPVPNHPINTHSDSNHPDNADFELNQIIDTDFAFQDSISGFDY